MVDSTSPEVPLVFQSTRAQRFVASPSTSPEPPVVFRRTHRFVASPSTSPEPPVVFQRTHRFVASPSTSPEPPVVFRRTHRFVASPVMSPDPYRVADEAWSSRKRQRVEEEEGDNGNRNRDGVEVITTEIPRNLLECPVCFHALTIPTFQCDNGHIACSSCCTKLRNICPTCKAPTGKSRCRFAESVVEASIVPCPNAKHGCTLKFAYGQALAHEEICGFALCYCPALNCNYTGIYKDLYSHHYDNHTDLYFNYGIPRNTFLYYVVWRMKSFRNLQMVHWLCFNVSRFNKECM